MNLAEDRRICGYAARGHTGKYVKRVAIVTGAGRGIGEATARMLARDGHTIALADLNLAEARRAAGTLPGDGHAAFQVDVVDERSVEELFDAVEARLGPVAVLACVAGGPFLTPGRRPSIVETTIDNWIRTEALNARGPFLCIRAMLRRRAKTAVADGRIITVSSMSGITAESPTGPAYSAAKEGGRHSSDALRSARGGAARHHRQHRRARIDRYAGRARRPDSGADRGGAAGHSDRQTGQAGGHRRNDCLSRLAPRRLHHRRRHRSERRPPTAMNSDG